MFHNGMHPTSRGIEETDKPATKLSNRKSVAPYKGIASLRKSREFSSPPSILLDRKLVSIEAMHHSCSSYSKDPRSYKFHGRSIKFFQSRQQAFLLLVAAFFGAWNDRYSCDRLTQFW